MENCLVLRAYPKSQQCILKSHNRSIISEYPFRFCTLHIVKVTAGNHFSDRLLVRLEQTCFSVQKSNHSLNLKLNHENINHVIVDDKFSHSPVERIYNMKS